MSFLNEGGGERGPERVDVFLFPSPQGVERMEELKGIVQKTLETKGA